MHAEDIKAAIRKKSLTQADVARDLEVSDMAVSHVIHGRQKSARVAKRISDVTGIPVSKLWPGKYPDIEMLESLKEAVTQKRSQRRVAA